MADNNQMLLYAAAYETVDAALANMDAVEQLHKDKMIGTFDRTSKSGYSMLRWGAGWYWGGISLPCTRWCWNAGAVSMRGGEVGAARPAGDVQVLTPRVPGEPRPCLADQVRRPACGIV